MKPMFSEIYINGPQRRHEDEGEILFAPVAWDYSQAALASQIRGLLSLLMMESCDISHKDTEKKEVNHVVD